MRGVATALFVALTLPAVASPATLPRLTVKEDPLVVRGTGFIPRERIKLTVVAGGRFVQTVVATARGTFSARFLRAATSRCKGYSATAVGIRGSRATIRVTRQCAAPPEPSP